MPVQDFCTRQKTITQTFLSLKMTIKCLLKLKGKMLCWQYLWYSFQWRIHQLTFLEPCLFCFFCIYSHALCFLHLLVFSSIQVILEAVPRQISNCPCLRASCIISAVLISEEVQEILVPKTDLGLFSVRPCLSKVMCVCMKLLFSNAVMYI